jgi:glycosyltransferase involved in cell wall biosynthesis
VPPDPTMSVVVCSLNGAEGVQRVLTALARQTIADELDVVLVDDGSIDDTSAVGHAHGVRVVTHPVNRGLSAARNSGVSIATGEVVAFLDDDCEPEPDWAEQLRVAYAADVVGVGGDVVSEGTPNALGRYLERNNPLAPLEAELAVSSGRAYRLWRYVAGQWGGQPSGQRPVYSLVGANMSFRREAIVAAGMFDERFTFGAEELDLCHRVRTLRPDGLLVVTPAARVRHHFETSLRDMLRRSRAYGRGSARMYRKWPSFGPTVFPAPLALLALLALSRRWPGALVVAALFPHALFPKGLRAAVGRRDPAALWDPYLQVAQEMADNVGFVDGLWRFRRLEPAVEPPTMEDGAVA